MLIGQPGQAAVAGIVGQAPGKTTLVTSPGSTATLRVTDARRVSYLLQPGIPVEDAAPVAAALRSRFPALHGPHPDGFCYAASDRAESVRVIAAASDVMLMLGGAGRAGQPPPPRPGPRPRGQGAQSSPTPATSPRPCSAACP